MKFLMFFFFFLCARCTSQKSFKERKSWASEMAQQVKALAAKPEDLGSNPETHVVSREDRLGSLGNVHTLALWVRTDS